jgi:hypothetical protein
VKWLSPTVPCQDPRMSRVHGAAASTSEGTLLLYVFQATDRCSKGRSCTSPDLLLLLLPWHLHHCTAVWLVMRLCCLDVFDALLSQPFSWSWLSKHS